MSVMACALAKGVHNEIYLPERQHTHDAGWDLRAAAEADLLVGQQVTIPLGVHVAIPVGYVGLICSRSGLAHKYGVQVTNAPGVIDASYRGELMAILSRVAPGAKGRINAEGGVERYTVLLGERICQLVIVSTVPSATRWLRYEHEDFVAAEALMTDRGQNGIGSTGTG